MTNLSPILIFLKRTICIQNAVTGSFSYVSFGDCIFCSPNSFLTYHCNMKSNPICCRDMVFVNCKIEFVRPSFFSDSFSYNSGDINVVCMSCQLCCCAPQGPPPGHNQMMEIFWEENVRARWPNGPWSISDKPLVQFYRLFPTSISLYSESWNENIPETFHQIKTLSNFVQTWRLQGYLENLQ